MENLISDSEVHTFASDSIPIVIYASGDKSFFVDPRSTGFNSYILSWEWWIERTDTICFSEAEASSSAQPSIRFEGQCFRVREVGDTYKRFDLDGKEIPGPWELIPGSPSPTRTASRARVPDGRLDRSLIEQVILTSELYVEANSYSTSSGRFVQFHAEGQLEGRIDNPNRGVNIVGSEDIGRWSIDAGDRLCLKWSNWDDAIKRCYDVEKRGRTFRLSDAGRTRIYRIAARSPPAGRLVQPAATPVQNPKNR